MSKGENHKQEGFYKLPPFLRKMFNFCSFRIIGLFFERKFMIHMLFLFSMPTLVTRGTMESSSEDFL